MLSEAEIAGSNFDFYNTLYQQINQVGSEELEPGLIANFLKTSGIEVVHLSQIWEIADYRKTGMLNRLGVFIAFKLVAGVQQGYEVSSNVLTVNLNLPPKFGNFNLTSASRHGSISASPNEGLAIEGIQDEWEIGQEDQRKFETIFLSLNPVNGRLTGDQCRPVLLNSQLPKAHLAKLADIDCDGCLDKWEMCVALHLVYKALQNEPLPDRLPITLVPPPKRNLSMNLSRRISVSSVDSMSCRQPVNRRSRTASLASLQHSSQAPQFHHSGQFGSSNSLQNRPLTPSLINRKDEEWPIDASKYETEFAQLDRNNDGFVDGLDVKDVLLKSGLPQNVLAHIWSLVDVSKSGHLRLDQFALCMELIREQLSGSVDLLKEFPQELPANLRPPSLRSHKSSTSTIVGSSKHSENPKIEELNAAIEEITQKRRKAEQDLFQLDADTTVKNSEIKNLEIELLTLNATVKQLKNQKLEAAKRLNDLENKIERLNSICVDSQHRLEAEQERLAKKKHDILHAKENFESEGEVLQALTMEYTKRRECLTNCQEKLRLANQSFVAFVDEYTKIERSTESNQKQSENLNSRIKEMTQLLDRIAQAGETLTSEITNELLSKQFSPATTGFGTMSRSGSNNQPDPFTQEDPFSSVGNFSPSSHHPQQIGEQRDPFAESPSRPFSTAANADFADFAKFSAFSS